MRYGVQQQVGWLFSSELVDAIRTLAKAEGSSPGKVAARLIRQGIAHEKPLSAQELLSRVRFPRGI